MAREVPGPSPVRSPRTICSLICRSTSTSLRETSPVSLERLPSIKCATCFLSVSGKRLELWNWQRAGRFRVQPLTIRSASRVLSLHQSPPLDNHLEEHDSACMLGDSAGPCPAVFGALRQVAAAGRAVRPSSRSPGGGDAEGGAPFVLRAPDNPEQIIGFEVELADALAEQLSRLWGTPVKAEFVQYDWPSLSLGLERKDFDIILNGFEITPDNSQAVLFAALLRLCPTVGRAGRR